MMTDYSVRTNFYKKSARVGKARARQRVHLTAAVEDHHYKINSTAYIVNHSDIEQNIKRTATRTFTDGNCRKFIFCNRDKSDFQPLFIYNEGLIYIIP